MKRMPNPNPLMAGIEYIAAASFDAKKALRKN